MNQATNTGSPNYRTLYRLGGVAALIVVGVTLAEVVGFSLHPQPSTVGDWFALLQESPLTGLLGFWGLEVPMYAMFTVTFVALYAKLKETNPSLMAIALALALLGIGVFFATNNPFSMLSLSRQYATATTDAQRAALLAAGQAVLANTGQRAVGGFNTGLFLLSVAGLMVSWVMRRSAAFGQAAGRVGLVTYGLSLADYVRQAVTSSEVIALLVILPNVLFLAIWYVMVSRRLYKLGRPSQS